MLNGPLSYVLSNNDTYSEFVRKLIKSPEEIQKTLSPEKINLLHMVIGVSGEAGELLDQIKKHVIYEKPLDINNVIEELGDLMFYMEGIKSQLNIQDRDIIMRNVEKLATRYQKLYYTNEDAINRTDKNE